MKNEWLDRKAKRQREEKAAQLRSTTEKRIAALRAAIKHPKKPCGCSVVTVHKEDPQHLNVSKKSLTINQRFLKEAQELEKAWRKSGLLEGLENRKWDRKSTAVLLEGQRLINERPFQITVRTKTTSHDHGFNTKEELFSHLDMLMKASRVWFFQTKLDRKPDKDHMFVFLNNPGGDLVAEYMMRRANRMKGG